jgi:hypothetical protein
VLHIAGYTFRSDGGELEHRIMATDGQHVLRWDARTGERLPLREWLSSAAVDG